MRIRNLLALAATLLVSACLAIDEPSPDDDGELGEAASAITLGVTVKESPSWNKTVTFCAFNGSAAAVAPVQWQVSWSATPVTIQPGSATSHCITTPAYSGEKCALTARVLVDNNGLTSAPAAYSLFDYRVPSLSPTSLPRTTGQAATLAAPAPHDIRHCDGTGKTTWQVWNGSWSDVGSSVNINPWSVTSNNPGSETYRLKSEHKGQTLFSSNAVTVTWVLPPSTCTIGGVVYQDGNLNPSNSCQVCEPSSSQSAWSNNDGYSAPAGVCKVGYGKTVGKCQGYPCPDQACESSSDCTAWCSNGAEHCSGGN